MTKKLAEPSPEAPGEDSSTELPAPEAIEDLIMREKEIKRLMRSFSKETISQTRKRMGKTANQHVVKFAGTMATFLSDNAALLQDVFEATKTPKRPNGQKTVKINTDRFKVSITKREGGIKNG